MTTNAEPSWVSAAKRAITPGAAETPEVDVIRGQRNVAPRMETLRDLSSLAMFGILVTTATTRATLRTRAFDPVDILIWGATVAFFMRALVGLRSAAQSWGAQLNGGKVAVALCDDGVLVQLPGASIVINKDDILSIAETAPWTERTKDATDVHLVLHPRTGRTHVTLPPVFGMPPGALAERLMRWRGVQQAQAIVEEPATRDGLDSVLYERAAHGESMPDVSAIRLGQRWRARMPMGSIIIGVAIAISSRHQLPALITSVGPMQLSIMAGLVCISPAIWWWRTHQELTARQGLALVLTPRALLLRLRSGVLSTPWTSISRARMESSKRWRLLTGLAAERSVVFERSNDSPIAYEDAFLGAPPEVVLALAEAYRLRAPRRESDSIASDSAARANG